MASFENEFWADLDPIDEIGTTKFDLKNVILRDAPWFRNRSIADDFTDRFNLALVSKDIAEVQAAVFLTKLRYNFFSILNHAGWNFYHINHFEMESMNVYWRRLQDRVEQSSRGFVTDYRCEPTKLPEKTKHYWMN